MPALVIHGVRLSDMNIEAERVRPGMILVYQEEQLEVTGVNIAYEDIDDSGIVALTVLSGDAESDIIVGCGTTFMLLQ